MAPVEEVITLAQLRGFLSDLWKADRFPEVLSEMVIQARVEL
jgi:hypothetical protein